MTLTLEHGLPFALDSVAVRYVARVSSACVGCFLQFDDLGASCDAMLTEMAMVAPFEERGDECVPAKTHHSKEQTQDSSVSHTNPRSRGRREMHFGDNLHETK